MKIIDADKVVSKFLSSFDQEIVNKAPAMDVQPIIHAWWKFDSAHECYECSNCGMSALNNYRGISVNSDYCPHCGSLMDGDD